MKRIFLIAGLATAFLLVVIAASAQKAGYAGTWSLDKAKSQGLSPRMQGADKVTLTITQDDKTISLEQKVEGGQPPAGGGGGGAGGGAGRGGGAAGPQTYNLDGNEVTSDVTFGQNTGKRTMKATMTNGGVELMSKTAFTAPDGSERVNTTTQKLSLSGDGKTLTIVTHREGGQQQAPDTTAVYNKQ
ncbi:MAG: hypothetical protein ABR607_08115 [Pyrinomonadaceae bacterium]